MANKASKHKKIEQIQDMIVHSEKFKSQYGAQVTMIAKLLVFASDELIDKIYAFLVIESKQKN